ncbi:MAG: efflux RND transporter periplasmic adaptor subunit [Polyangiaceae bacterium]
MTTIPTAASDSPPTSAAAIPKPSLKIPRVPHWVPRVVIGALVVAGGTFFVLRYQAAHPKPLVHYETALVDLGPIAAKVTATGAVSALVTVLVGSQVSGRIATLGVDFGSPVKKGQTIATIEPSLLRAAVAQARANFASANAGVETARTQRVLAERNDKRTHGLTADGLATKADLDAADAALGAAVAQGEAAVAGAAQAKAALDQTELNLTYATIVSPIDGIVISRSVDVGQTVAAALQAPTLFTIAEDLTRMQVDTNVAESDVGKIKAGMPVTFTVEAYPQRVLRGVVRQIRDNAQTIQNVVTYDAVVDVDNSDRVLKPGMTASVTFTYATRWDVLRLPNVAVRFKPDSRTLAVMTRGLAPRSALKADERVVWVIRDGAAVPETVRIGINDGSESELLAGNVHAGERVAVEATLTPAGVKKAP